MNATTLPRPVQAMTRGTESAYRPLQHEFHFAAEAAGLNDVQRRDGRDRLLNKMMNYLDDRANLTDYEVRQFIAQAIEEVRGC